jgi:hypothetical protein
MNTVESAYAEIYARLEKGNTIRDAYRTALANCYISLSGLLESKRFDLTPEFRKRLGDTVAEVKRAI